jgi:glycogen synthase
MMAALEIGQVQGMKSVEGHPLNISSGGVGMVLSDTTRHYPEYLTRMNGGQLTVVGVLMDGISREGLTYLYTVRPIINGQAWNVSVHEHLSPSGTRTLMIENPAFLRMTATPNRANFNESVYTFRGLPDNHEGQHEQQRIFSAIAQSIAEVHRVEQPDAIVLHDYHVAPAAIFIDKLKTQQMKTAMTTLVVHNQAYMGSYYTGSDRGPPSEVWNLSPSEIQEYFMQDDHLVLMAPALRVAERNNLHTAISVSEGTANTINMRPEEVEAYPRIDFFRRVGELTNGLSEENRPHLSPSLKPTKIEALFAEGIRDPDVVQRFSTIGYAYAFDGQEPHEILRAKADAKEALQKNFDMDIDPQKPLYVSFARMVQQKGLEFAAKNVEHIINSGGQIIVGGPVGDWTGAQERQMFLDIKDSLHRSHNPNAKNFIFIDGPVKGAMKGLMLAGGDFFLLPSRYEPCGLTDAEALYHGTIPIAHNTGGLSKGKNTLLYGPTNPHDQGWELGQAINQSLELFQNKSRFQARQLAAMKEDFSMEKNFERLMQIFRIEVYGKMLRELDAAVDVNAISAEQAKNFFSNVLLQDKSLRSASDISALVKSLGLMHPDRHTPLMTWVLEHHKELPETKQ